MTQNPSSGRVPSPRPSVPVVEHGPCGYVRREYGETIEEMREIQEMVEAEDGDLRRIPQQLAQTAISVEGMRIAGPHAKNVVPAQRTQLELKCGGCAVRSACLLNRELQDIATVEKREQAWQVLRDSPEWLVRYFLHAADITPKQFVAIMQDPEVSERAVRDGFSVERLMRGVHCRSVDPLKRDQLPKALADALTSARNADSFPTHELTFQNRDYAVQVSNLWDTNGYDQLKPTEQAFGILLEKFVGAMKETGPDGRPLILSTGLQKVVRQFEGGYVAEIRMTGKSRLYTGVFVAVIETLDTTGMPVYRVLLLGGHGDNERLQQKFYDQTGLSSV